DADDYLQPNALQAFVDAAEMSGGAEVIYSDFWSEYADGRIVNDELPDYECDFVLRRCLHSVTALYPAAAFRQVGGFTPNVPWEDWDLEFKLAEAGICARRIASPLF